MGGRSPERQIYSKKEEEKRQTEVRNKLTQKPKLEADVASGSPPHGSSSAS